MEFTQTQKGRPKLMYEGYLYTTIRQRGERKYWRCEDRACTGRCVTTTCSTGETQRCNVTKAHNHAPSRARTDAASAVLKMKEAASGQATTSAVINEVISNLPSASWGALPNQAALRRMVQRERKKHLPTPPETSDGEVQLVGPWRETALGEDWVIPIGFQAGPGESQSPPVILATVENLKTLADSHIWYGDGSFLGSSPESLDQQLYTIHADYRGTTLPLVYCIMPDKSVGVYSRVFRTIQSRLSSLDVTPKLEVYRADMDTASHAAVLAVFNIAVQTSFFHFAQAHYRHIVDLNLQSLYREDPQVERYTKMMTALAFVPVEDIHTAFSALKDMVGTWEQRDQFSDYVALFERTYIGRYQFKCESDDPTNVRLMWQGCPQEPRKWSVYARAKDGEEKLNGHLETWHKRFYTVLQGGEANTSVYKLVDKLKKEQTRTEELKMSLILGGDPKRKTRDIRKDEWLLKVTRAYPTRNESGGILNYLKVIADNLEYIN